LAKNNLGIYFNSICNLYSFKIMQIVNYIIVSLFTLAVFVLGLYVGSRNKTPAKENEEISAPKKPKGLLKKKKYRLNSGPIKALQKNKIQEMKDDPFNDKFEEILNDDM